MALRRGSTEHQKDLRQIAEMERKDRENMNLARRQIAEMERKDRENMNLALRQIAEMEERKDRENMNLALRQIAKMEEKENLKFALALVGGSKPGSPEATRTVKRRKSGSAGSLSPVRKNAVRRNIFPPSALVRAPSPKPSSKIASSKIASSSKSASPLNQFRETLLEIGITKQVINQVLANAKGKNTVNSLITHALFLTDAHHRANGRRTQGGPSSSSNARSNARGNVRGNVRGVVNYKKLDNTADGRCSLYALFGFIGMRHGTIQGNAPSANLRYFRNQTQHLDHHYRDKLHHLINTGNYADNVATPTFLLGQSVQIQQRLRKKGFPYYIVVGPQINDRQLKRMLHEAQANDAGAEKLFGSSVHSIRAHTAAVQVSKWEGPAQGPGKYEVYAPPPMDQLLPSQVNEMDESIASLALSALLNKTDEETEKYANLRLRERVGSGSLARYENTKYKSALKTWLKSQSRRQFTFSEMSQALRNESVAIFHGDNTHWVTWVGPRRLEEFRQCRRPQ